LFGAPVKVKPGYRKFLPAFAPLNLGLSTGPDAGSSWPAHHFGIQFETSVEVTGHLARLLAAGVTVREEMGVSCCHSSGVRKYGSRRRKCNGAPQRLDSGGA
jgi:hypothetical protein